MPKKKETCPYCGREFVYLSRHKCKVKKRLEGAEEEKTEAERRRERIERRRKLINRKLKKEEKEVLGRINDQKELFFEDLLEQTEIDRNKLDEIVEILQLQNRIKVNRELVNASWTKHIYAIEAFEGEDIKVKEVKVDRKKDEWLWQYFSNQPCFTCPYSAERCSESYQESEGFGFNPHTCPFLGEWINKTIEGEEFQINWAIVKEEYEDLPE